MSLVNKDAAGMRDHVTVMPLLPNKDEQRLLGFILIVFLLLTAISNFTIPLFEAPDEDDHYRFALWLAYGNGLPDLNQLVAQVGHEAWQTPLYYYLLSPVMRLANGGQPDEIAPRSVGYLAGYSIVTRIHSQAESWPYVGTSLAVHLARLITSLFGVGTILVTFGLARLIWPRAAWVAAALVAFNPQFIYLSAAISNDVPAACLAGLTMCWLVRGLHQDSIGKEWNIVLGILAGLAVMTKLSNLVLVIPIGLALLLRLKPFRQTWRRILADSMLLLIAFVSIAGWWFLSNWLRYHDWLAWQPMLNLSVGLQRGHLLNWFEALQVSAGLLTSFWLNIGNGAPQFYLFFDVLMLAAAIGLGAWLWQQLRQHTRRVFVNVGLIAVWISLTFISLLQWMRLVRATDQGRLLYPVISGLAVLLAVGLMQIAWRKWSVAPVLVAGLFIAAALTPVLVTMPAYAQPRPLPMGEQLPNPR
ncbi:MAG TPA: phospholipid carrier-dependent glycosyltransferase, partial [Anaerolineae bacterium]|nr:phospholipid carrier-dependent glycosyltransferase [Anaerolineae bacterium]